MLEDAVYFFVVYFPWIVIIGMGSISVFAFIDLLSFKLNTLRLWQEEDYRFRLSMFQTHVITYSLRMRRARQNNDRRVLVAHVAPIEALLLWHVRDKLKLDDDQVLALYEDLCQKFDNIYLHRGCFKNTTLPLMTCAGMKAKWVS
jgi:hypothetical protein